MSLIPHHTSDPQCPLCQQKLSLAHPELVKWFNETVKPKFPDAHISWSFRDELDQQKSFDEGKSKLHFPNSAHNKTPAMALDLFEIVDTGQGQWNPKFFAEVDALNQSLQLPIEWGQNFVGFHDADHFQLKT